MTVSVITVKLYAPWVHSLKEKRMIVNSITHKLRNKFNVSVIEAAEQDIHQTIVIGIAYIAATTQLADCIAENIAGFIESNTDAEMLSFEKEIR